LCRHPDLSFPRRNIFEAALNRTLAVKWLARYSARGRRVWPERKSPGSHRLTAMVGGYNRRSYSKHKENRLTLFDTSGVIRAP
jgi:hypothetical protein